MGNITLSWNVKSHSPIYTVTSYKNEDLECESIRFSNSSSKQVSRPVLPLLVIGLSIMTDILFCVNTLLLPVSVIHFSSHAMCSMCMWLCECRARQVYFFFYCPSKIREVTWLYTIDCNFYISVIYSIMTFHTTLRSTCIELAGQEELGGLVNLLVW